MSMAALNGPSPGPEMDRKYKIQIQMCLCLKRDQCLQLLQQHKHILEAIPAKLITKQRALPVQLVTLLNSKFIVSFIVFRHQYFLLNV